MLKHLLRSTLMAALLTLLYTSFPIAQAAPGDLDRTFAGFGAGVGVVNPAGFNIVRDIAIRPDGKLVIVGNLGSQLTVARYLPNGQPDNTFHVDGRVTFSNMFIPVSVALQNDGRIVVGGTRNSKFHLVRLAPDGALDSSFGSNGGVVDADPQFRELKAILVQTDGKIVACGNAFIDDDNDMAVTRYNPNGSRDLSFSGDGKVTIPFGAYEFCNDVARQPDGKLVVAGYKLGGGNVDFAVARLNPDGTLDSSFDGDGKLTTGFGGDEGAYAVAIQPDGKIVAVGYGDGSTSFLARYLPNGALDGSFDGDGKLSIPAEYLRTLAMQPDGKIVVVGYHTSPDGDNKLTVRRLNPNGALDPTFDGDGTAWLDFGGNDQGYALALLPDGRILAGGASGSVGVLAGLRPDGSFDTGGKQIYAIPPDAVFPPGSSQVAYALAVAPDGGLLVAGERRNANNHSAAFVTRFYASGHVDPTFGALGTAQYSGALSSQYTAHAIALQPDGKIVTAGYRQSSNDAAVFLVIRFHPNGARDTTFDEDGIVLVNFDNAAPRDYATAVAIAPDGKIVVAGNVWNGSRQVWGVARLTQTGAPDTSFGPNQDGRAYLNFNGSNTAHAVAVQPDGKIVVAGHANGNFALARLLNTGLPDTGFGGGGVVITDLGGDDIIRALALAANGWLYAAGYRVQSGNGDMALAQYRPDGTLAQCAAGKSCSHWPDGKRFVNLGGFDLAAALALREDNQLVAAGCSDAHMAAAQVSTSDVNAPPLVFQTDFVGPYDCALGVAFSGASKNRIVLAGQQADGSNYSIALARFETTAANPAPPPTPPPGAVSRMYLPIIMR